MKITDFISDTGYEYFEEKRAWGCFENLADNIRSTTKILKIRRGEMLSLQFHEKRDQLYYILDEGMKITFSEEPFDIKRLADLNYRNEFISKLVTCHPDVDEMFFFRRGYVHRAEYGGEKEYGRILDIAFGINDEQDIIRLQDKYNRQTTNRI